MTEAQPGGPFPPPPGPPPAAGGPGTLAGMGARLGARVLDTLILAVPGLALIVPQVSMDGDTPVLDAPLWVTGALLAMSFAYEVGLVAWRGQTLGKMALRIRVARVADAQVPTPTQAGIRFLLPSVIGAIPYISLLALVVYASALWNPLKQGWHDRAAGTIVLKV
ncbi:hypothetical protein BH24ACT3_BH24ACT3_13430 [soil metagenome]